MLRESDYIQQLANYIKKNLSKGYTTDSLRWALVNQGYSRTAVSHAVNTANEQLSREAPKMIEKPVIKVIPNPDLEIQEKIAQAEKKSFWEKIKSWFR